MIRSLSFLSPGNFPDDDPYPGLEDTLRPFGLAAGPGARSAAAGARRPGIDTYPGPGHTCSLSVLVIIY